ncbi:hypothetical protein HDU81_005580 [Chytriomyces hyalinus]|nr:hypothetical protein HDU81_005580 [Chytriomyces hyalinus]
MLCLTCFNQLRIECTFNKGDKRCYTCPICKRAGPSSRLFSATPNPLMRAPMNFVEIMRELALLVPRSSTRHSNKLLQHAQKEPEISATTSTAAAAPITNISYPPSALRLDGYDAAAASASTKPARMRLGMGSKKAGMLLPGNVLLRNKVEFLHKEFSDVAGLVVRVNFYQNSIVEKYAARESKLVTLRQLTVFGRHLTLDKLLRSANYVREELPVRLAHRIIDIQHLPFIVGTNPHIQLIYSLYWQAFEAFRLFPEIKTIEQNRQFCRLIESQLQTHLVIIPQLAMGMAEASTPEHMSAETADRFLNEMLRSRIGRRVLAEQHIALSDTYEQGLTAQDPSKRHNGNLSVVNEEEEDGWIGIVNTRCRAGEVVERVSALAKRWFKETSPNRNIEPPEVKIDGHANAVFTYIPDHIEYILFELLKNSMRFTLETHGGSRVDKTAGMNPSHNESHNLLDDDRLFGLTWNEPGILPGYSKSPLRRSFYMEQKVQIYGTDHLLTHLEPISPNHLYPPSSTTLTSSGTASNPSSSQPAAAPVSKASPPLKKLPPIVVTVGASRNDITFRVSDQGGGFAHTQMANLWSYTHASRHAFLTNLSNMPKLAGKVEEIRHTEHQPSSTEMNNSSDLPPPQTNTVASAASGPFELEERSLHLGLGLPMSRVYANYWGGTIGVHSMHGYGTDAYVKISLGNQLENLKYRDGEGNGFV